MRRSVPLSIVSLFLGLLVMPLLFSSCVSQKRLAYFQGDTLQFSTQPIENTYTPRIQTDDILAVRVSSLSPEASEIFNAPSVPVGGSNIATGYTPGATLQQPIGYLVDARGNIEMPLIGRVKLAGLTTREATDTLKNRLQVYLKEPTVNIRFLNYKISVLGEVVRPSVYTIPNEKITILEALSLAGDMTIYGRRDNVLIIRESNGVREFSRVNLNDRNVFRSPNYYLRNNDVVYIEPVKTRSVQTERLYVTLPLVSGIVSALALLVLNFRR
jgi:polysaccharide export outer membrane protein